MVLSTGKNGAGNEVRTRDLNLGKVALYQLSYSRVTLIVGRVTTASSTQLVRMLSINTRM